jgi:peroxiredoxin Q/BCP
MKTALLLPLLALLGSQETPVDLKVGDQAPEFASVDHDGKAWKSSDHVGKQIVVLYFYPAAFTGGCTGQAMAYKQAMDKLSKQGAEVIGISGDGAKAQAAFRKHLKLDFTLLCDEKGDVAKQFGVPVKPGGTVKQKLDNAVEEFTRGVTIERWTFIIGLDGKIAYKNSKVNPTKDSEAALEAIAKMK